MTSNVGQNYPYTSETEVDRARVVERLLASRQDLGDKLTAETTPLDPTADPGEPEPRWWVWKCPTKDCDGLLHAAGYARDLHAVYVVCDGTCGKTFLR